MVPKPRTPVTTAVIVVLILVAMLALASTLLAQAQPPAPPVRSFAATISLQEGVDGYRGCQTTVIRADEPDRPHLESSPGTVGNRQTFAIIVHFSLYPVPTDAQVTRATLQLKSAGWSGTYQNLTINAFGLLRAVTFSELTWLEARWGWPWAVPGARGVGTDRRTVPESTVTTTGPYKWYDFDVTGLVQAWLSGAVANNGVLLEAADTSTYSHAFGVVAGKYPEDRPRLVIEFGQSVPTATVAPTNTPTPTLTPTRDLSATLLPIKLVEPESAAPGDMVRFTLAVMNDMLGGQDPGTSVSLQDTLPPQLEIVPGSFGGGMTYNPADRTLTWLGSVPRGGSITLSFRARVATGASVGASIRNELRVTDAFGRSNNAAATVDVIAPSTWTAFLPWLVRHAEEP